MNEVKPVRPKVQKEVRFEEDSEDVLGNFGDSSEPSKTSEPSTAEQEESSERSTARGLKIPSLPSKEEVDEQIRLNLCDGL